MNEKKSIAETSSEKKKVVYIAHPIGGDVKMNIYRITQIVRGINKTREDVIPFAPYIADAISMNDLIPEERERALNNGLALLERGAADELWIYGERISAGMQNEIVMARFKGMPVVLMSENTVVPGHLREVVVDGCGLGRGK